MRRIALTVLAAALVAAAAGAQIAAAQTAPSLTVHAIFTGGRATSFHVGEVLDIAVRNAGGRKVTQICMTPAPIARPQCSTSENAAPSQPGTTTITATLGDGTKLTRSFRVHAPATKVGGRFAVPATIHCQDVTIFGNYDRRHHRSLDRRGTVRTGARVALYNRIGPDRIFMWDYATNLGGFGSESCATTASA
jgi:hypothetical protein